MVNYAAEIYLTDFQESTFGGENAKNPGFCAKMTFDSRRVYHDAINYGAALRNRPVQRNGDDREDDLGVCVYHRACPFGVDPSTIITFSISFAGAICYERLGGNRQG